MAQDFTAKKNGFITRYSTLVSQFLTIVDSLQLADAEFANDAYGTGGANAITDADVQAVLPASTAALFNSAEASVVTCLNTVASVRSALESMRK